jgi:ATP adenylyltransferase/5',5'''-P-1,P-4-tetraphosphate phosphorylase II
MSDQDYSSDGGNFTGSERNNKHHSYANSAKRRKSSKDNDYSSETSYEDYLFTALQKQAKTNREAKKKAKPMAKPFKPCKKQNKPTP